MLFKPESTRSVMPIPASLLNPHSRHYRSGLGEHDPHGRYLDAVTKENITGITAQHGYVDVTTGRPRFIISNTTTEPAGSNMGVLVRANLFRKTAGWKWMDDDSNDLSKLETIISVQTHAHHHYALRVVFENSVTLWRNEHARCEPRLRPTTHGHLSFENKTAEIDIRGHHHVLWHTITISADIISD